MIANLKSNLYYVSIKLKENFIKQNITKTLMAKKTIKRISTKKTFSEQIREDFSREHFIEGGLIRPIILLVSFSSFILAMFLLLLEEYKWGGSVIIFSFVLNIYSIYESLNDKDSIFKTLNLIFKITLFSFEIIVFNWLITVLKLPYLY